jgi:energy-converting hydrogenase Eha subunit G
MDTQTPSFFQNLKRKALKLIPSVKFWAFIAAGLLLAGQFGLAVLACGAAAGLLLGRNQNRVSVDDDSGLTNATDTKWIKGFPEDESGFGAQGLGQYICGVRVDED